MQQCNNTTKNKVCDQINMALTQATTVYIALACSAIILSTVFILAETTNYTFFIIVFSLYLMGSSAYVYAYLTMKKSSMQKVNGVVDTKYNVANYISIYNVVLSFFVFIIAMILVVARARRIGDRRGLGMGDRRGLEE